MKAKPADRTEKLLDEIHDIHVSAWSGAAPPASKTEAYERVTLDAMRNCRWNCCGAG